MKKKLLAVAVSAVLLTACNDDDTKTVEVIKEVEVVKEVEVAPKPVTQVKNIILMIGDGMGAQQVGLLEEYARRAPNSTYNSKDNQTALSKLANGGHLGLSLNAPHGENGSLVVDSACSATQLATGKAAGSEMIGLDDQGYVIETILEKAKKAGKATGLVSDTRLTHATPAAFAAHQPHRSYEPEIAVEMVESGMVDVMLSGGARAFLPEVLKAAKAEDASEEIKQKAAEVQQQMAALGMPEKSFSDSKRKDDRNVVVEAKELHGYELAFDNAQLSALEGDKILGLFAKSGMADGIAYRDCKADNSCTQPSLKEMTVKALDILSKDEDGFFLMIEGGQIDWAGHANDAGWMLNELLKFDEAVEAVHEWAKERTDTLVVVTADHETGSFGFSYSSHNKPEAVDLPGDGMQGKQYKPKFNFGGLELLDTLYGQKGTFYDVIGHVNGDYDFSNSTDKEWQDAIKEFTPYEVTIDEAARMNEFSSYNSDNVPLPKFDDFSDFYVYGTEDYTAKVGRIVAKQQNVVWGTGTHTAAPVPVYAFGPEGVTAQFSTLQHHVDIGTKMIKALGLADAE
ncbi:alkaline phosphatase [Pseudoalteromonas ardens]|uniref:Alkaline phosphatase n=1 Tax=Pseudoalteromonas rubra TaxID=43658 RepID=A0A0L0ET66_9GAMM|nr:alkaline phosphatase [Pseudoalteromonas sp. R96]KNC67687.1 alkaline phosphatase [Pseudoalteromonas rubra]MDK1312510.1 alkaline phosphatase [Pseudoalteromonas sp. R96]